MHAAFAAGADFAVVLDCVGQGIEFSTGADDSALWFDQETVVRTGTAALQSGSVEGGDVSILEAEVNGAGTFTYWVRLQNAGWNAGLMVFLDNSYLYDVGDTADGWVKKVVPIADSGAHKISLYFGGDDPDDICWVDSVSWEPAPEEMEIAFDTGDGPAVTTCRVPPGTTYGELPKPAAWNGHDFCGWYLDPAFAEKVNDDDLVQFRNHTLCARWATKVNVLDTDDVKFTTTAGQWYSKESANATNGYELVSFVDARSGDISTLTATVTGAGTLTFKVKRKTNSDNSCSCEVNGEETEFWHSDGEWHSVKLIVRAGASEETGVLIKTSRYSSAVTDGGMRVKDFVWKPAANDSITVT